MSKVVSNPTPNRSPSSDVEPATSADPMAAAKQKGEVPSTFEDIHALELERLDVQAGAQRALCLSGGGIRSATFSLGVLQGLADRNLLSHFDYLSTVSGGGYIGSWLTAWIHNHNKGVEGVEKQLKSTNVPEPREIAHLRQYSNYLAPKQGLFSADTWALASIMLRNLMLNWLVLLPVFFAALLVPRFVLSLYGERWPLEFTTGGVLSLSLLGIGIVMTITGLRPKGKPGVSWFNATLVCLLASAILFPVELDAEERYAKWAAWLGDAEQWMYVAASAMVVMFALHVYLWKKAERFSQRLRILNASVFGATLAAAFVYLFVDRILPFSLRHPSVCAAYVTPLVIVGLVTVGYLVIGLAHTNMSEQHREWLSALSGRLLCLAFVWAAVCSVVFYGPVLFYRDFYSQLGLGLNEKTADRLKQAAQAITAVGGIIGGAITAFRGHDAKSSAGRKESGSTSFGLGTALGVFIVALVVSLAALADVILPAVGGTTDATSHLASLNATEPLRVAMLASGLVFGAIVLSRYISLNKFSLHSMYRNRLIKAYFGASRASEGDTAQHLIPRFDPRDDVELGQLAPGTGTVQRPLHIVNMALNLQGDDDLAWQERRAESFTASPLHTGYERPGRKNGNDGYRPSNRYGGLKDRPITLGTAMAISGAAANPNMGYHSSPLVTFVMTLFNARLGWWLGNPGKGGSTGDAWVRSGPALGLGYLLSEALGLTTDASRFVNLSDGGHFENLGLYEAVRRRCRVIVVVDGGCDPSYSLGDLGNAIRKCRIDLGAEIDFGKSLNGICNRTSRIAIGHITYKDLDKDTHAIKQSYGRLVYVKPVIVPEAAQQEPIDVLTYQRDHEAFPNESTADQFFSESQFESYRRLGLHTILTAPEFKDEVTLFVDVGPSSKTFVPSTPPAAHPEDVIAATA